MGDAAEAAAQQLRLNQLLFSVRGEANKQLASLIRTIQDSPLGTEDGAFYKLYDELKQQSLMYLWPSHILTGADLAHRRRTRRHRREHL